MQPHKAPMIQTIIQHMHDAGGLTDSELAEKVGVDPSTVSRWRAGDVPSQWHTLKTVFASAGVVQQQMFLNWLTGGGGWFHMPTSEPNTDTNGDGKTDEADVRALLAQHNMMSASCYQLVISVMEDHRVTPEEKAKIEAAMATVRETARTFHRAIDEVATNNVRRRCGNNGHLAEEAR